MDLSANMAAGNAETLVLHAFIQEGYASLWEEYHHFRLSKNHQPAELIGIHLAASQEFESFPLHFVLNQPEPAVWDNHSIIKQVEEICTTQAGSPLESCWFVIDMGWLRDLADPFHQQSDFIEQFKQSLILKHHQFVFYFNWAVFNPVLIQQSLPYYPQIYWKGYYVQNPWYFNTVNLSTNTLKTWFTKWIEPSMSGSSEDFFHQAYDPLPIPFLEADYTAVFKTLNELKAAHPDQWRTLIQQDTKITQTLLQDIRILHANTAALQWTEVDSEDQFFLKLPVTAPPRMFASFQKHLLQIADNSYPAQFTIDLDTVSHKEIPITLDAFPPQPGEGSRMIFIAQENTGQMRKDLLANSLYKISQLVHTESDLNSLYRSVHSILNGLVNAKNLYIALYDEEKQSIQYPYHVDEVDGYPGEVPLRNGKTDLVIRTGETIWVAKEKDLENVRQGKYTLLGTPASDWLGVPLISQGKTIGVITIQTYDGSLFSENEKSIMEFCSSQVALAIERKIAEKKLKQNQQDLTQILMSSPIPTRVIDRHLKTILVNRAYEKLTGLSAEEINLSNQRPWGLFNQPDHPTLTELIAEGASAETIHALYPHVVTQNPLLEDASVCENLRIQTQSGSYWINITVTPLKDLQGQTTGAIENLLDMSQRMKAEDDIRKFKTVVDYANMGMMIANLQKEIVYVNAYLSSRLGYEPGQLLNKPLSTLFKIHYPQIEHLMEQLAKGTHELRDFDVSMQSLDGRNIPFLINAVKFETSLNQETLISFACINISSQKKREEALNRYANRLEILHKIDEAILEATSTEEIARSALHIFLQLVKFSFSSIIEFHQEDLLNVYLAHYDHGRYTEENYQHHPGSPALRKTLHNLDLFISQDADEISDRFVDMEPVFFYQPIHSCMVIPLLVKHEIIGQFLVGFTEEDALSSETIEIIKEVSRMISIGIYQTRLYEKIEEMATIDELTGIYNRRQLIDLGERALSQALRFLKPLSVIVFDVDQFKHVNDTFGHPSGDQILKAVVKRCQAIVRTMDVFGRYGGDEFVVILPETNLEQANQVAARLISCINATPFQLESCSLTLSISIGISELFHPTDTLTTLINQADESMYLAKKSGRNRIVLTDH